MEYIVLISYYKDVQPSAAELNEFYEEFESLSWIEMEVVLPQNNEKKRVVTMYETKNVEELKALCRKVSNHGRLFIDFVSRNGMTIYSLNKSIDIQDLSSDDLEIHSILVTQQ